MVPTPITPVKIETTNHLVEVKGRLVAKNLHHSLGKDAIVLSVLQIPLMTLFEQQVLFPGKRDVLVLDVPIDVKLVNDLGNLIQRTLVLIKKDGILL